MSLHGRALHYVFKIADRTLSCKFYKDILGMKVLRHEEFTEGCGAQCNGPYDNRWSKTMIGYGIEDTHFVLELTYNYNVSSYELGNDFLGIYIRSKKAVQNVKTLKWPYTEEGDICVVVAPGGYKFYLINDEQPADKDPVEKVKLASSNLEKSLAYWNGTLGMKVLERTENCAELAFDENQARLVMHDIGEPVQHCTSYGRIAFSIPKSELYTVEGIIRKAGYKIVKPLIALDTPGKATVTVVILADPDGHEICFVDDEGFRELSKFDPDADADLVRYICRDEQRKSQCPQCP